MQVAAIVTHRMQAVVSPFLSRLLAFLNLVQLPLLDLPYTFPVQQVPFYRLDSHKTVVAQTRY